MSALHRVLGPVAYPRDVPGPGVRTAARWWRHALLGFFALGLSLMCAGHLISSTSTLPVVDLSSASAPMSATDTGLADDERAPASGMAGVCDAVCVHEMTTTVCSVIAVAAPLTLLVLLVTRRRRPFLGLSTRTTVPLLARGNRGRWRGWSQSPLARLCVLQV